MLKRPAVVSGALRLAAVAVGGAAVAMVLQQGRAERPSEPPNQPAITSVMAPPARARAPQPRGWSFGADGWYIRVDGVAIDIPSLAQQTASAPRASLARAISPFDRLIEHHAKAEGFDWRLIAALIFEESHFDPTSRSDRGAYGLMQIRPIAAEDVGADRYEAPDDNIKTGVRYLRRLDEMFTDAHGQDRLGLVLAAYNIGPGHVRDAQSLARHFGYSPNRWRDGVDLLLPLLEHPAIHEHLPNGFARGSDTVAYVERILKRYRRYQHETGESITSNALSSSNAADAQG